MHLLDLFERAADRVRSLGLDVEFEQEGPFVQSEVEDLQRLCPLPIPSTLIDVYRQVGTSLDFSWAVDVDDGFNGPSAMVCIAPLAELVARHVRGREHRVEWNDDYEFTHVDSPAWARETARRMRRWLAFHHEGNGDAFCLDTRDGDPAVLFNQHDWFDGGSGCNGTVMGASLSAFFEAWAQTCFQRPSSLWWPEVLRANGVDWHGSEFSDEFRMHL